MNLDLVSAFRSQGKALPDHPVFHDDVPTSVYSPGASRQDAKLSQRDASRHLSGYGGSQAIDYLMDCVDLVADQTSTAVYRLKKDGVPQVRRKDADTPQEYDIGPAELYDLLERPNPHMLYDHLISLLVIDLLLCGNGYWLKWGNADGRPISLFRLAPQYVKIIPGAWGPTRYEYQPKGAKDPLKFAPEDVLHFKRPNPHDAYYGMGVVKGGGRAYDFELALTDSMSSYMENKAEPSLIVQSERRVPRDVFQKLRAQLRSRVSGTAKRGELLVLEAGLTATTLSPNAQEAMYKELAGLSRDRIFAMFRASPKLFGYTDSTAGSDKIADARREFDTYYLRPFMDKLQRLISVGLTQAWGVDFEIVYRYSMPLEDLVKNAGLVSAIPGIKVREIRRFVSQGIDITESTGDREIDETILNMPTPELDANGQPIPGSGGTVAGKADRNLPGEAGRPPKGENTAAFNQASNRAGAKALEDPAERLQHIIAEAEAKALLARPQDPKGSPLIKGETRPADPFAATRTRDVDDIAAFVQDGLADATRLLERELLDHVEGKAWKPNNIRSRMRNSPAWKAFTERVNEVLMDAARQAISRSVMQSGRVPDEDLDYDAIAESVVKRPEGLRAIVRNTKERLLARVGEKVAAKGTQSEVEAVVREFIADFTSPSGQSSVIGISEAVEAYNEGTLSVAEVMGIEKVHVVEEDDAPDEACQRANNQLWDIPTARANRKEHPNCRRYFLLPEPVVAA